MSYPCCPNDGTRLVQVAGTNAAGDPIHRWECPLADWEGPWYTGLDTDEIHQIPEVSRTTSWPVGAGGGGGGGVDPVAIKDGTVATQKLAVDVNGRIGINNFPAVQPVSDNGGSLTVDGTVAVSNFPSSVEVSNDVGNPLPVSGTVTATQGTSPWVVSGTVTVTDGSGPLTVDGTVELGATSLAALESITVQNGAGVAAVNIQDGGNSITVDDGGGSLTVDGTVAVTQSTSPWVVSGTVTITDGSGPVTVDGTVGLTGFGRDDTDNQAAVATGLPVAVNRMYVWDSVGGNWDRYTGNASIAGTDTPADARANPTTNLPTTGFLELFNGATWDRARSGGDNADAIATATLGEILSVSRGTLFNGTTWDRHRSAPGVTGAAAVGGPTASDSALAVAPVTIGGRASIAAPTDVGADGRVVNAWLTRAGRQRVYNSGRRRIGLYNVSLGATTVTAAADAATGGRWWLQNPVGSTVFAAVRRIYFSVTTSTGLLEISAPVFTVERFTFTGTASGASLTPMKRDSTDPANTVILRTASTGMTITAGAAGHGFQVPGALATTSANATAQCWPLVADEDEYIILRAGEGIVIRQATAGTTADTRICNFDIQWEEFNSTDFKVND